MAVVADYLFFMVEKNKKITIITIPFDKNVIIFVLLLESPKGLKHSWINIYHFYEMHCKFC